MDFFFMTAPELNVPAYSYSYVSDFGEKILQVQPDNLEIHFSLALIYYSQWIMSWRAPDQFDARSPSDDFSGFANRMDKALKLIHDSEPRFKKQIDYWNKKSIFLSSPAIHYFPNLRQEVIASSQNMDALAQNNSDRIKARNMIAKMQEINKDYSAALATYQSILTFEPKRIATLGNVARMQELLKDYASALSTLQKLYDAEKLPETRAMTLKDIERVKELLRQQQQGEKP